MDTKNAAGQNVPSIDWLAVSLNLLECFRVMEGTWYEGDWGAFDITPEQAKILKEEHKKKFS